MSVDVSDAVAEQIVARLSKIATDETFNDIPWATSVIPTVLRLAQNARTLADYPSIVVSTAGHKYSRAAQRSSQGLYEITTTFQIECYIEVYDEIDTKLAAILHDLRVAIGSDFTMGGTCRDSYMVSADLLLSAQTDPLVGLVIEWVATYRTSDTNPGILI